jgi:hypothetical protein
LITLFIYAPLFFVILTCSFVKFILEIFQATRFNLPEKDSQNLPWRIGNSDACRKVGGV